MYCCMFWIVLLYLWHKPQIQSCNNDCNTSETPCITLIACIISWCPLCLTCLICWAEFWQAETNEYYAYVPDHIYFPKDLFFSLIAGLYNFHNLRLSKERICDGLAGQYSNHCLEEIIISYIYNWQLHNSGLRFDKLTMYDNGRHYATMNCLLFTDRLLLQKNLN